MSGLPFLATSLTRQSKAGTLFNTYTTAKTVLNPEDIYPIPGNTLRVGSAFRISARGGLSNRASTPGTFAIQIMMGAVVAFTTGNLSFNASARTLLPFWFEAELRVDSTGSGTAAKFLGMARLGCIHLTNTDAVINVPTTAPAVGTGFDSSVANNLDFFWAFGTSDAGNGVQLYDYEVVQLAG